MENRVPLTEAVAEEKAPEVQPNRITLGSPADNPDLHTLSDFFDVDHTDRLNPQINEKMFYLLQYAMGITGPDKVDAMLQLKGLKKFLGVTEKGPKLVERMYKFARLDSKRQSIVKEMRLLHED